MERALRNACFIAIAFFMAFLAGRITAPTEDLDALVLQFQPHPIQTMFWTHRAQQPVLLPALFGNSPTFLAFKDEILQRGKPFKNDVTYAIFDPEGECHHMTLRRDAQLHPVSVDVTVAVPGTRRGYRYTIKPDGSISFAGTVDRKKIDEKIALFFRAFAPNEKAASQAAFRVAST